MIISKFKALVPLIAFVIALILFTQLFLNIVVYLSISIIVSLILKNAVDNLSRLNIINSKISRVIAIVVSFLVLIILISLFTYSFVPLILDQINFIASIKYSIVIKKLLQPLMMVESYFKSIGMELNIIDYLKEGDNLKKSIDFIRNNLVTILNEIVSYTGDFFAGTFSVIFITFFILYDGSRIKKYFVSLIPNRYFEISILVINKTQSLIRRYLLGLLLQMSIIFSLVWIGMLSIGMKYAITIALFSALSNVIPIVGPIIGSLFGLIISSSSFVIYNVEGMISFFMVKVLVIFLAIQLIDNLILQPSIFSRVVKAHPLEIFIAILGGANLGGALGMIIAIPTYTFFRLAFTELYKGYNQYSKFRYSLIETDKISNSYKI